MSSARANPFASPVLAEDYVMAGELRKLVINLYNGQAKPDMSVLMVCEDERRLALAMLEHYAEHGENCPVFMRVAQGLVDQAMEAA